VVLVDVDQQCDVVVPVAANVLHGNISGFCTSKGELVRSILYPKELMFKFYEDAVKFVGVLACLATVGMVYSAATLIMKHVSHDSSLLSRY